MVGAIVSLCGCCCNLLLVYSEMRYVVLFYVCEQPRMHMCGCFVALYCIVVVICLAQSRNSQVAFSIPRRGYMMCAWHLALCIRSPPRDQTKKPPPSQQIYIYIHIADQPRAARTRNSAPTFELISATIEAQPSRELIAHQPTESLIPKPATTSSRKSLDSEQILILLANYS